MNRLPPLRLLTTFDAVARLRSMQLAADELNVTPPAITQSIKALEDHIGLTLLDRSSKPARLTTEGERLAQATRSGLGLIGEMIDDLRYLAGLSGRHLTVSCTIGVATYWLMPRLPDFYARFDNVTVNVQAPPSDLPALTPGIDVALRYGRRSENPGETIRLFDEVACPVGTPEVVSKFAGRPEQLSTAPLIHVRSAKPHHWAGWGEYLAARGLPKPIGPAHIFDNYIHAVQAAMDGRGLMLGWKSITQRFVHEGNLIELPDGRQDFGTSYFVTTATTSRHKTAVADFVRWLIANAPPQEND